jgi:hypothetical protein
MASVPHLKGTGISTLWPQMLALAILGSAILTLSVLRFHNVVLVLLK